LGKNYLSLGFTYFHWIAIFMWIRIRPALSTGNLWIGGVIASGSAIGGTLLSSLLQRCKDRRKISSENRRIQRLNQSLQSLTSFNWLKQALLSISFIISKFINFLTRIFESEGGLFWSILMLVLILTLAGTTGAK